MGPIVGFVSMVMNIWFPEELTRDGSCAVELLKNKNGYQHMPPPTNLAWTVEIWAGLVARIEWEATDH
jgi:hypothetical protein